VAEHHAAVLPVSWFISEVALALILMIGGRPDDRKFRRVSAVNPGFDPQNLRAIRVSLAETKYPTIDREVAYFDQMLARVRQTAGNSRDANSISAIDSLPFAPGGFDNSSPSTTRPKPPPGEHWIAHIRRIDTAYFAQCDALLRARVQRSTTARPPATSPSSVRASRNITGE